MDTKAHPELINTRFAYVAVSRASHDAQIYTNDAGALGQRLSHDVTKSSAVDFRQEQPATNQQAKERTMDAPRDLILEPEQPSQESVRERIYTPAEHKRHYAPLNNALHPEDAYYFVWKAETGTLQSYQHAETHRHIHIDGATGQFYDQQKNPISQEAALDRAMGAGHHYTHSALTPQPSASHEFSESLTGVHSQSISILEDKPRGSGAKLRYMCAVCRPLI